MSGSAERDRSSSYVWGPAMRHAIHAALALTDPPLSAAQHRVLLVALELTASWRKMDDRVVRKVIAQRADVSEKTVSRSLKRFDQEGVLGWKPAKAAGQLGTLSLPRGTDSCPECACGKPETRGTDNGPASACGKPETRDKSEPHAGQIAVHHAGQIDVPLPLISNHSSLNHAEEMLMKNDRIVDRLSDAIPQTPRDEWDEYVDKLRKEGIGDLVLDEAAGFTIDGAKAGKVHSPRGYFLKTARDWYAQRTGAA